MPWLEAIVAALVVIGAGFTLIGSLGLMRMPDFFTRLHGPSKATTIGIGSLLVASALYLSTLGGGLSVHEFLISLFIAITSPVGSHLLAKAARHRRLPGSEGWVEPDQARNR
ncbi:MAG: Na+/H+ antiporter subunit G [Gammaproteobacteria bacterium]|nr:Na+/H+ antiporter subunit G [Gammaproteobacteria bacterium]MDH5272640.1 Na+/H+ antiporter subunit G [Gammaproteobacteria bacterium]